MRGENFEPKVYPRMKSQRSFVVERKSSRRLPKAQTSSIWGDTDFKALVREVEVEAPNMFEEQQKPAEQPAAAPTVIQEVIEAPEPAADGPQTPEVVPAEKPVEPVLPIPAVKARRTASKAAAKQPVRSSRKTTARPSEKPEAAAVTSDGALMELEDANRELKALLRGQFEAEHAQLLQMLERVNLRNNAG